jgi:hypothetical protein
MRRLATSLVILVFIANCSVARINKKPCQAPENRSTFKVRDLHYSIL